jgi:DNA invertase Pin-like site-specific DNA recombinase
MRCAIYARYSSDLQRATSIEDQIRVATEYAAARGWTVLAAHIYSDAGISGASIDGRPGMQALLRAVAERPAPFDVLLADDTSRVSRDPADAHRILQRLTFHGVRLIYIAQSIDSASDQAEVLVGVHGIVDSLYRRELTAKSRRGVIGQLERGYSTGARTYGYRSVPVLDLTGRRDPATGQTALLGKRLEIDEAKAAIVRRVFEDYAAGTGVGAILWRLHRDGVPNPTGGRQWAESTLRRMLGNERVRRPHDLRADAHRARARDAAEGGSRRAARAVACRRAARVTHRNRRSVAARGRPTRGGP